MIKKIEELPPIQDDSEYELRKRYRDRFHEISVFEGDTAERRGEPAPSAIRLRNEAARDAEQAALDEYDDRLGRPRSKPRG